MAIAASAKPKLNEILRRLMFERDIRAIDLARFTHLPQPTVQRIVAGTTPNPHISSLVPIAEFFKVTIEQLRGIEPIAWDNFQAPPHPKLTKIPIISWHEAIHWSAIKQNFRSTSSTSILFMEDALNEYSFALSVEDSSMSPLFPRGTLLIIDPNKAPRDRSYVVARLNNHPNAIFRQLLLDVNNRYLKALSPDLEQFPIIALQEDDEICGTLIQTRRNFVD